ncbi:MAG: SAM-dependent methyltransferase [Arachnia propionica]|uniref:class I SAM-dependent methyltransferase n=1 Tax=Arachnia propionica TaxID=1750 RepID=UPI0027003857|nr:SAM-dependent methyltransferase [Arachnia propionica]
MDILGAEGARALVRAAAEADPDSIAAGQRMRREFPPDLAAAALTQVALRRRARAKLPQAERLFLTPHGLEQATRWPVAQWRAELFRDAGVSALWDLGCGLGVDAMAFAEAGLRVCAVEADPTTAAFARANLQGTTAEVITGLAEEVELPPGAGVFLDPARRTARGRTWDVSQFTPPWSLVEHHLDGDWHTCVKLGPGLPKELIPDDVAAVWVSVAGDVVEVSLWNFLDPGPRAVVMRGGRVHTLLPGAEPLPVGELGEWIHEPDNAVIRAGLVAEAAPHAHLLAASVAYLTSDAPLASPFATDYKVLEVLENDTATLRHWVKAHRVGSLEIKRRAIDVDPAVLRRQLRPKGDAHATMILTRTTKGAKAVVVERQG